MKVKVIGGGAAGFFAAINLKEMRPDAEVTILERGRDVLRKVAVSGGGRCNLTNTFEGVDNLADVYPRGHRLMRKLFHSFGPKDAKEWFEKRGVRLVAQSDHCIFPATQSSQTVIDCLTGEARKAGVKVMMGVKEIDIDSLLNTGEIVVVCTGGMTPSAVEWLGLPTSSIEQTAPSLFSLSIKDSSLHNLKGTVATGATAALAGSKIKAQGDLLITHWGVSGPAILRLTSYGALWLRENGYKGDIVINWLGMSEEQTACELKRIKESAAQKIIFNAHPSALTGRLWEHIATRAIVDCEKRKWHEIGKKEMNKLIQSLTADTYPISGRAPYKDEFVTAGGVSLNAVNSNTLESKDKPGLYFAGEVLDIDGVTGGFNFTAAWSTAMAVARAIGKREA